MHQRPLSSRFRISLALCVFVGLACGGDDDLGLDRETVTNLPTGTGTGSSASGEWDVELLTTNCDGTCPVIGAGTLFSVSTCDVGVRFDDSAELTQTEGALRVDLRSSSLFVTKLEGGINADNTFDIGGFGTVLGDSIEITARGTGTVMGDALNGEVRAWGNGSTSETEVDCIATYELTGSRR